MAQLVEHRAVTREVVSSTPAGPTLTIRKEQGVKSPGVVAVLCVVPSGLVLDRGITSCTFSPWTEMSKKNGYV